MDTNLPESKEKSHRSQKIIYSLFLITILIIVFYYLTSAPFSNQSFANRQGVSIHVAKGQTLDSIAKELEQKHIVRHSFVLKAFVIFFKGSHLVPRGDYVFKERMPAWKVGWWLASGHHNIDPIKVTFKEGVTNDEIIKILSEKLVAFRKDLFVSDSRVKQGYLFPDTYFFFPQTTSEEIVDMLTSNFDARISKLESDIKKSGHNLSDIIRMASLIEKEANGDSDSAIISGILWKRISNGMLLQVDASPITYKEKGLPTTPISNPGLVSIKASINPKDSPYLYYLHDKSGMIHLARTYPEHQANINRYLR